MIDKVFHLQSGLYPTLRGVLFTSKLLIIKCDMWHTETLQGITKENIHGLQHGFICSLEYYGQF